MSIPGERSLSGIKSVYARATGLKVDQLHDDLLISDGRSGYYALEGVSARIWQLLDEPRSLQFLCDHLMREYAVNAEECYRHVMGFLSELESERLVVSSP